MTEQEFVDTWRECQEAVGTQNKPECFRDITAVALLTALGEPVMGYRMISSARDGEIVFTPEVKDVCARATKEYIVDLILCGVYLENGTYFCMSC